MRHAFLKLFFIICFGRRFGLEVDFYDRKPSEICEICEIPAIEGLGANR